MADAEIQTYRDQLAFVNMSLEGDPTNADLLELKNELLTLIDLTTQAHGGSGGKQSSAAASSSAGAGASGTAAGHADAKGKGKAKEGGGASSGAAAGNWQDQGQYKAGMDCMAKYKDGKWYPARISAVVGSADSPLYTIIFKGYSSSTNVPLSSLKPHDPSAPIPTPQASSSKRGHEELSEREKEKKKKKGEKWMASQNAKTEEVREKKAAWEKFGKKAQKKGIHISGLEGKSVFRTPDNPFGRVGVVGSGKGITEYEKMGKHKFQPGDDN